MLLSPGGRPALIVRNIIRPVPIADGTDFGLYTGIFTCLRLHAFTVTINEHDIGLIFMTKARCRTKVFFPAACLIKVWWVQQGYVFQYGTFAGQIQIDKRIGESDYMAGASDGRYFLPGTVFYIPPAARRRAKIVSVVSVRAGNPLWVVGLTWGFTLKLIAAVAL